MSFEEFVKADGGEHHIEGVKKLPCVRALSELYTTPDTVIKSG